jgi:hypothetical protein
LAPANATDLAVGVGLLADHADRLVLGDKAYVSATAAAELCHQNRIRLQTLPRRNQKKQMSSFTRRLINQVRQMIEAVNAQPGSQFNIETNHAHTLWGLCTRLYSKLAAHTMCIYINRLLGKPDFLQIKALTFPNQHKALIINGVIVHAIRTIRFDRPAPRSLLSEVLRRRASASMVRTAVPATLPA